VVLSGIVVTTGLVRSLTGDAPSGAASSSRRQLVAAGVLKLLGAAGAATPAVVALAAGRLDNPLNGNHQAVAISGIASASGTKTRSSRST
jgi:hypothetical protein